MQETPQHYTKRILAHQQGKNPVTILGSTPGKIGRLLRGVPAKRLTVRPGAGKWSVAEILGHLADTELVSGFRIRLVLGSNRMAIQAFDQNVWADFSRYAKHDPKLSFDAFRIQRQRNLQLLALLPRKMWNNYGMHAERGKETVRRMTEMMAGHDINHLLQIKGLLQAQRAK